MYDFVFGHRDKSLKKGGRAYAERQVRDFLAPEDDELWRGGVMGAHCFYGFMDLDYEYVDTAGVKYTADFGGWLPNHAIEAVVQWLKARNALKKVS